MKHYLVGDIGGTNSRLAIVDEKFRFLAREELPSKKFKTFNEAVLSFVKQQKYSITEACFGIPCPISNSTCQTPNLPWKIDRRQLEKNLKVPVTLINDLEAVCYGLIHLTSKDFIMLNKGRPDRTKLKAVVGAGTGLGISFMTGDAVPFQVFPSEGGHGDFSPQNKTEIQLLEHLQKKFGRVSCERVVSGPGIENIHQFITGKKLDSKSIVRTALSGDSKCKKTLQLFSSSYGSVAGNIALTVEALGGVYLSGGIAPHVLPHFKREFLRAFFNKGRLSPLMRHIPVKIITNPDVALFGAVYAVFEE